ncbi:MAG: hypothetical protein J0M04_11035 [Verrucomicrobia bacterium]|nr:hypothetical protein [Verrucomicrobiota bacterium]
MALGLSIYRFGAPPRPNADGGRGFALVVTLSLMVLLALLAVGLLTLGSVALRAAGQGKDLAVARANARLGLLLAIGELQREAGPDQRITASAAVLAGDASGRDPGSASFDPRTVDGSFRNPRWMGTWDSWTTWMNNMRFDQTYQAGRRSKFRRWLVSSADSSKLGEQRVAANGLPDLEMIGLVGSGTLGAGASRADRVEAPLVKVRAGGSGGLAWWVSGDNQRALIRDTGGAGDRQPTIAGSADRLAGRPQAGTGLIDDLADVATDPRELGKCPTVSTLAVTADGLRDAVRRHFHDLTAYSVGQPVNVRDGRLKYDLNLLLERSDLPSEYGTFRRANPGGSIVPIRDHSNLGPAPQYPQNINLTSWYKLHQFYQLALGRSAPGAEESAADCNPIAFKPGLWWSGTSPAVNFNWEIQNLDYFGWGRTPIVSRLMVVFSLRREASRTDPARFAFRMSYNPVMVLWNPYNVTLHSPPLWMAFTPGGLQFKSYRNGTADGDWQPLARDAKSEGTAGSGGLFDVEVRQSSANAAQPIILLPGETRIFSAKDPAANTQQRILLTPGYKTPADNGGFDITLPGLDNVASGTGVEIAMRLSDQRTDHGGQYQMYWTVRNALTGESQRFNEVAANPVRDGVPLTIIPDSAGKRIAFSANTTRLPFASFEFVLKSGEDLRNRAAEYQALDTRCKNFIHAKPWNNRAMYGEATNRMKAMAQYDVHVEAGSGNQLNPDYEKSTNRAYLGSAVSLGNGDYPGQTRAILAEIPLVAPVSLAAFDHFRLNPGDTRDFATGRHLWDISTNDGLGIGSSFANPLIPGNAIYADVADAACRGTPVQMKLIRDYYDHVFLNNDALWDRWFCSGVSTRTPPAAETARSARVALEDFLTDGAPLPVACHVVDERQTGDPRDVLGRLFSRTVPAADAHRKIARHLNILGAFNVNSNSVDAWKAVLGGLREERIRYMDPSAGTIRQTDVPDGSAVVTRFALPCGSAEGADAGDPAAWGGPRYLTEEQTERLARECVRQVKLRGPFLNMADFVNRRLANDETGLCGALQAAIDWDEFNHNSPGGNANESINGRFKRRDDMITTDQLSTWRLGFPKAGAGSRWTGIPGYVTQADLLRRLGNGIAVRDDTFTIRAYGEARAANGTVSARAWCEAVVVRAKDYVSPENDAEIPASGLNRLNRMLGRRFETVTFRWLSSDEI